MDEQTSPLVWASYLMAKEFGWTPQQVQAMTMGQIDLYLEMIARHSESRNG